MSALSACAILAQLVVVAPSGYVGTVSVGDRTEARVRTVILADEAVDFETSPYATLALNGRRSNVTLTYAPRFSLFDAFADRVFGVSHSGRLALGWMATQRLRLEVGAEGTIGSQLAAPSLRAPQAGSTESAAGAVPPASAGPGSAGPGAAGPTFSPSVSVLNTLTYRAQAGAFYRFSRRTQGDVVVAYGGGKGLDAPSRAVIGPYSGPAGTAEVTYTLTPRDQLATRVRATYTYGSLFGSEYLDVTPSETWTHAWSPRTTGHVGAGLSYLSARTTREQPKITGFYPFADAALTHTIPLAPDEFLFFRAATRLSVQYDPVLQASREQLLGALSSGWTTVHYGATASVEALTTLPTDAAPSPARQVSGGLLVFHAPTNVLRFELGARGYVQDVPAFVPPGTQAGPTTAPGSGTLQWLVFAAVVITAPPVQL